MASFAKKLTISFPLHKLKSREPTRKKKETLVYFLLKEKRKNKDISKYLYIYL
jgi:hypothetical protein